MLDLIVPVHSGEDYVRRCLASVQGAACGTAFELVVVDDCSPQASLSAWLSSEADAGRITLLRNEQNEGFVVSVNRAMALHPGRDVVLLNSDTEVAGNWLDRLASCVEADTAIGTATPFTNNGSICSYPHPCKSNELPAGWTLSELDAVFDQANAGASAELPTGVGFCMYVRRSCWDAVGGFDSDRFGRGYGEENDFCLRAATLGWKNVLCADVFIYHQGSVSFGTERFDRMRAAEQVLDELHPDYRARVWRFLRDDSLRPLRDSVSRLRSQRSLLDAQRVIDELIEERDLCSLQFDAWLEAESGKVSVLTDQRDFLSSEVSQARARGDALDSALADAARFVRDRESDVATLAAQITGMEAQVVALNKTLQETRDGSAKRLLVRVRRAMKRVFRLSGKA